MSGRTLWLVAALIVTVTAAAVTVLWWPATRGLVGDKLVTARFEALKIGLSLAIGGGGVLALYLGWRRQRATEADLDNRERALELQQRLAVDTKAHQDRVAEATEKDARERRITDLYTKAADLLGSDKAPVRLAGMYALERLGQDAQPQRQTIINVLCAYLRMPYKPPLVGPPDAADVELVHAQRESTQEGEVRLTAQRLLQMHLKTSDLTGDYPPDYWNDIDLDLSGAVLIDFSLVHCRAKNVRFRHAIFVGVTNFNNTTVTSHAEFSHARFESRAEFIATTFAQASFAYATFAKWALFRQVRLGGKADFWATTFERDVDFEAAQFERPYFARTTFHGEANFALASFTTEPNLDFAEFSQGVPSELQNFWPPRNPRNAS